MTASRPNLTSITVSKRRGFTGLSKPEQYDRREDVARELQMRTSSVCASPFEPAKPLFRCLGRVGRMTNCL
jgi:hypothetical protein